MNYFFSTFHRSRIKRINPGIIIWCYFSFLFHQRAFGNFHFRQRDRFVCRCWLGVPICRHRGDRLSLTDFRENHQVQTKLHLNVCIFDQLHPCTNRMQNTQTQLSPEQTRACKVYHLLEFFLSELV